MTMRNRILRMSVLLAGLLAVAGPATAGLRGKVLDISVEYGFVFLDLGEESGVKAGDIFVIFAPDGAVAARVKITKIYTDLSEGDLIEKFQPSVLRAELEVEAVADREPPVPAATLARPWAAEGSAPVPPVAPPVAPPAVPPVAPPVAVTATVVPPVTGRGEFSNRVSAELVRTYSQRGVVEHPLAVAVGPDRRIYFLDTRHHAVLVWQEGQGAAALPTSAAVSAPGGVYFGRAAGQFVFPGALTCDRAGNLYVVDTMNHRVQIFERTGRFKKEFGGLGTGPGKLMKPGGIAVSNQGDIFVADTGNDRVQQFSPAGAFVRTISATSGGALSRPAGLAITVDAKLLVTDGRNRRVAVFDFGGNYVKSFGSDVLVAPRGIATDTGGTIYVADPGAAGIQVFDRNGIHLGTIADRGLDKPFDLEWHPELGLLVADPGSDAIYQYRVTINP